MFNTRITKIIAFALFGCLPVVSIMAQQIVIKPLPFEDKLPVNSIFNLYQDSVGFIWIATANGIGRYDAYDVQEFRNDYKKPHKLSDNDVRCFAEDAHVMWIGTAKGISLMDKTTYETTAFPDSTIQNSTIRDIFKDTKGNVWVSLNNSVFRCDAKLGVLKEYKLTYGINSFFEDKEFNLWFLGNRGALLKYDEANDILEEYAHLANCNLYRMTQDNQERFWIATWGNGIWRFNPEATDKRKIFDAQQIINPIRQMPEAVFYDIVQDNTYNYLWALSHFRLYVLKINKNNQLEEVDINTIKNINSPIDQYKAYSRVMKDNAGNLWFGAYDKGYSVVFENKKIENHIFNNMKSRIGLDANIIYINKDKEGIVWYNQGRYGICLYNELTGRNTYGINNNDLYSIDVMAIIPSAFDNSVWLGGRYDFSTKLWRMKQHNMQISIMEEYDLREIVPSPGKITQIAEDKCGNVWIGTASELFIKPAGEKTIHKLYDMTVSDIKCDNQGNAWIACTKDMYQMKYDEKIQIVRHFPQKMFGSCIDNLKKICVDKDSNIWFATSLGRLFLLDRKEGKVIEQTVACELVGNDILEIHSYDNTLWIVCAKDITCHNISDKTNITYSVNDDNIFVSSFRYGAAFVDHKGVLYAGGHKGYIKILPEVKNTRSYYSDKVLITDVTSDNRSVLFSPSESEKGNSINQITLTPDARNIEIVFSALPYSSINNVKYAYKLNGVDEEWTYIENGKHSAFYNYLDKGRYVFQIKAMDVFGNEVSNGRQLIIHKRPAWHETIYAYILYGLLALFIVSFALYLYTKRLERKNKLKLQNELTQMKLNYFTNISHELLTPLTIISCIADDLEENETGSQRIIDMLRNNVSRLKRLLQQVLDFRKVENCKMSLNISIGNISMFLLNILASSFQPLAHKKNIRLSTRIEDGVWGYIDFDKLDKVVFNLLSNAIKYTPEQKNISVISNVVLKDSIRYLKLCVEDEGVGIAEKDLKHIFTKFYNNKNAVGSESNGIGLSLTKELLTIHHGSIEVSSKLNQGSVFTAYIPIDREVYSENEIVNVTVNKDMTEKTNNSFAAENKHFILFIDDNTELLELMYNIFRKKYHVATAANGIEGIEMLKVHAIDIIICDVMMPKMNGLAFCNRVKNNLQTSHIPIIMLTAKNATKDQIACYEAKAESYITKPFDMKVLQARIENLLQKVEQRQDNFRKRMGINISNLDFQSHDEQFLSDAIQCIEHHIRDAEFDIEQMAIKLNMSRSTLTRKIRVIAGLTPLEFIRNIKFKHACVLLKDSSVNISEVAYSIGFTSPKYFTKCFKEEFGMTPTEYQSR